MDGLVLAKDFVVGTLDAGTGGGVSDASAQVQTFFSTEGSFLERAEAAGTAGREARLDAVTLGFYGAEDKTDHAFALSGLGGVESGAQRMGAAIASGDLHEFGLGLGEAIGGGSQFTLLLAGGTRALGGRGRVVDGANAPEVPMPEGVVYHRIDLEDGIDPYVGQAKSPSRYARRQTEHGRDNPDADFVFEELGRAEPGLALDVLEEDFIRIFGGPTNKGNPNGALSNKRYQMSEERYRAAGGQCDRPDCG